MGLDLTGPRLVGFKLGLVENGGGMGLQGGPLLCDGAFDACDGCGCDGCGCGWEAADCSPPVSNISKSWLTVLPSEPLGGLTELPDPLLLTELEPEPLRASDVEGFIGFRSIPTPESSSLDDFTCMGEPSW